RQWLDLPAGRSTDWRDKLVFSIANATVYRAAFATAPTLRSTPSRHSLQSAAPPANDRAPAASGCTNQAPGARAPAPPAGRRATILARETKASGDFQIAA